MRRADGDRQRLRYLNSSLEASKNGFPDATCLTLTAPNASPPPTPRLARLANGVGRFFLPA
jgi:hypothetical protein